MKERFICSFVLIMVHDTICKTDASSQVKYFPYLQICVNITEDGRSIDRNLQYTCKGVNNYIQFMFCQGNHIISVIN